MSRIPASSSLSFNISQYAKAPKIPALPANFKTTQL